MDGNRHFSVRRTEDVAPRTVFTPHAGAQCPVGMRQLVRVLHRDGEITTDYASEYVWIHLGKDFDVIGYRVIDPDLRAFH